VSKQGLGGRTAVEYFEALSRYSDSERKTVQRYYYNNRGILKASEVR